MDEQRLINLETKVAHQEYLLEELNQVIYEQQKTVDRLQQTLLTLTTRLKELMNNGDDIRGPNEKPPHY